MAEQPTNPSMQVGPGPTLPSYCPADDASNAPRRWRADNIKAYRKKIQALCAATDERDLYAMRSRRLERLKGNRAGIASIRLNVRFRLIIKFETDGEGRMVIVIEKIDDH